MFTPTLRCECAQPGLIDTMRKWSIDCFLQVTGHWHQGGLPLHTCFKKMCDRVCFSQMSDVLFASLRVSKLQKIEKGSIL